MIYRFVVLLRRVLIHRKVFFPAVVVFFVVREAEQDVVLLSEALRADVAL
jgi:hypothetical protein